jgi:hypothetical protein
MGLAAGDNLDARIKKLGAKLISRKRVSDEKESRVGQAAVKFGLQVAGPVVRIRERAQAISARRRWHADLSGDQGQLPVL